ncbi:MAG: hypothetical protein WB564_03140 [Dehalococcoidia bacterium]
MNMAIDVQSYISSHPNLGKYVDSHYQLPEVHKGSGTIKFIILGQDPTIKNKERRKFIKKVLNLDKCGRLRSYLVDICNGLGVDLDVNVYATNYLKNFFDSPPTQIKEVNIFQLFEPYWLPVLLEEIEPFPDIPIISLGQPLLKAIAKLGTSAFVRNYWGYTVNWKSGERGTFRYLEPALNKTGRMIFPFPHQPSLNKEFYRERLAEYIHFIRSILA